MNDLDIPKVHFVGLTNGEENGTDRDENMSAKAKVASYHTTEAHCIGPVSVAYFLKQKERDTTCNVRKVTEDGVRRI